MSAGAEPVSFVMGGHQEGYALKAQYAIAGADSHAQNTGAKQIAAGYDYPLGKKATLYVVYSRMGNNPLASFTPADYGHGRSAGVAASGDDPYGIGLGVTYDFAVSWK
jgi:predicted porin